MSRKRFVRIKFQTKPIVTSVSHLLIRRHTPPPRGRAVPFVCFADISPHCGESSAGEGYLKVRLSSVGERLGAPDVATPFSPHNAATIFVQSTPLFVILSRVEVLVKERKRADPKPKDVKPAFGIYYAVLCNLLNECYYKNASTLHQASLEIPRSWASHSFAFFRLPRRKKVRLRGGSFFSNLIPNNISPLHSG